MPHSRALLSMSQIALVFLWIFEGDFKRKLKILKEDKTILIFSFIFFLHIIGLIYTNDFETGFSDIKIKLPLLLFPLIIGTSEKLNFKEIKIIILVFSASVLTKTLLGTATLLGLTGKEIIDIQDIAGSFSHIRYSLLLNISLFSILYLLIYDPIKKTHFLKFIYVIVILWLTFFLFILHSVTGWIIFILLVITTSIYLTAISKNKTLKISGLITSLVILIFITVFIFDSFRKFYHKEIVDFNNLEIYTESGNKYSHYIKSNDSENGYLVNIYLCEKEMKEEWNKISEYKYEGYDKKNQQIKYTLIRYLSSKGFRKDKLGIQKLSRQDILNIESGLANYIYENKLAVYPKIYEILWQIDRYNSGGNPQGHSVTQRIEFIKTGKEIILKNFFFGVGTGDLNSEYQKQYQLSKSKLSKKNQLRAHNQYITFFITFGFIGFVLFMIAYIYPPIKAEKFKDYLFLITFIILTASMINEDTLETQMGATTFAFFISFFLFAYKGSLLQEKK